jgi:recombination protein RecA
MTKSVYEKMMKDGVLMRGDDHRFDPVRMPVGLVPLDDAIGGGLQRGTCVLIVGPESTGKTILCQYMIAAQQKTDKPHVLFLDAERTYDADWWALSGVDTTKLFVARPSTAEQLVDLAMEAMDADDLLGMIVLDSIAALPPSKIVDNSAERTDVGSLARLATPMYVKFTSVLGDRIFIATNQLRDNIGGYGDRYPGGQAQRYFSHLILRTRREGWIEEDGKRVGFNLEVSTAKNKTAPPQETATLPFLFRGQVDILAVTIDDAVSRGTIRMNKPYYYIGDEKFMGKANLRKFLSENPDVVKGL